MRDKIAKAIIKRFEETYKNHGVSYDPDTCYEAADEVIFILMKELLREEIIK